MLKKMVFAITFVCFTGTASAHEVWVDVGHTHGGDILKAALGYGDFPALVDIPEERLHIFQKPMQYIGKDMKPIDMVRSDKKNIHFTSPEKIKEGSYLVTAEYSPTFWSKNQAGWKQENLKQMPDATYCEQTRMYGKMVVNVGHETSDLIPVTKAIGQGLEIVPLDNPANARIGEPFPLQVLFNGEPLEGETVVAVFDGFSQPDPTSKFHKLEPQAFSDTTLPDGKVNLIPLRKGFWKVRVVHKSDYPDQKECQKLASYATLTFMLGESHEEHEH